MYKVDLQKTKKNWSLNQMLYKFTVIINHNKISSISFLLSVLINSNMFEGRKKVRGYLELMRTKLIELVEFSYRSIKK